MDVKKLRLTILEEFKKSMKDFFNRYFKSIS